MTVETGETGKTKSRGAITGGMSYGSMLRTGLVLILVSFLVGIVMDFFNIQPLEFWRGLMERIGDIFEAIFSIGWGTISLVLRYILFGAAIVIPVWLVIFLLNMRKR